MQAIRLRAGAKLLVSTDEGEQEDEVVRVVNGTPDSGVWIVETARNGRVVVMRGHEGDEWRARRDDGTYGDIPGS
jgi:hypothetical protein